MPHMHAPGRPRKLPDRVRAVLPWLTFAACLPLSSQSIPDYELEPIRYSESTPSNAVTRLEREFQSGALPAIASDRDLLRRCLDTLKVPPESQVLVFSKTSLQRRRISPETPRALYFSDDAYVGWVPGGIMELAITDPHLGLVFYQVDPRATNPSQAVTRDPDCLSCHASSQTRNWPGLMVRSVVPDSEGEPISSAGSHLISHESPFEARWGGWYVTGRHGNARHQGNVMARNSRQPQLDTERGANQTNLASLFDTDRYLQPESDIIALLVLEHQVEMHNRLSTGGLRVRRWMHYQQQLQRELGEPVSAQPAGTALRVLESEARRIVEYLLFVNEAPLPEGLQGNSNFLNAFRANRKADPAGRSLKDLHLHGRLFTHRCSYMIHSLAFASLPGELQTRVFRELDRVLSAPETPAPFQHLEAAERHTIREILLATVPCFAAVHPDP
jgi:hypothetical protein